MRTRSRSTIGAFVAVLSAGSAYGTSQLPAIGAGALLHPWRRPVAIAPPPSCEDVTFDGAGVTLKGWHCHAASARRATLVYLHGVADNRTSGLSVIERFLPRGLDVVAYDSRAHGESGGEACTYGFFEHRDLRRVLDTLAPGPIILAGGSLGAAVALQATADNPRVSAVIAVETFSDLRTVAMERAPFFFTHGVVDRAFELAEQEGAFDVEAVSPLASAPRITAPVLLIHGDADVDTPVDHSRRVFAALGGRKQLVIVPGAGHNGSLREDVWRTIEEWLSDVLAQRRSSDRSILGLAPATRH